MDVFPVATMYVTISLLTNPCAEPVVIISVVFATPELALKVAEDVTVLTVALPVTTENDVLLMFVFVFIMYVLLVI